MWTKIAGYSVEEAAGKTGVTVISVKRRVHRAIRAVQKRLCAEELP